MNFRRESLIDKAIRRRFAVTLTGNEGTFSGVLVESDAATWVFENCSSVPNKPGETPVPWPGRVYVDRINVSYLQEVNV